MNNEVTEQRKYELRKVLASFWENRLKTIDYKELSEFILQERILAEEMVYIKTLQAFVEFEEE